MRYQQQRVPMISIHALREEGDVDQGDRIAVLIRISIHALREEGDRHGTAVCRGGYISIHALREEGDFKIVATNFDYFPFLSTPSARRATNTFYYIDGAESDFYPRPPRGGRHFSTSRINSEFQISIHALREEGDGLKKASGETINRFLSTPSARRATSIRVTGSLFSSEFLSTPSARRATGMAPQFVAVAIFLSTPSARRATSKSWPRILITFHFYPRPPRGGRPTRFTTSTERKAISIHALREEGDIFPQAV